jgi:hypothetical protein
MSSALSATQFESLRTISVNLEFAEGTVKLDLTRQAVVNLDFDGKLTPLKDGDQLRTNSVPVRRPPPSLLYTTLSPGMPDSQANDKEVCPPPSLRRTRCFAGSSTATVPREETNQPPWIGVKGQKTICIPENDNHDDVLSASINVVRIEDDMCDTQPIDDEPVCFDL